MRFYAGFRVVTTRGALTRLRFQHEAFTACVWNRSQRGGREFEPPAVHQPSLTLANPTVSFGWASQAKAVPP